MSKEVDMIDHVTILNDIVENFVLKGVTDPSKIAKSKGMTRAEVSVYLEEWREVAANNYEIQGRARELLTELDRGYNQAIKEWWNIIEDVETPIHVKNAALKNVTDAQAKRHEVLQKAGLYDDMEGIAQLRDAEEMAQKIKDLLRDTVAEYPITRDFITRGLQAIFKEPVSPGVVKVDVVNEDGDDV